MTLKGNFIRMFADNFVTDVNNNFECNAASFLYFLTDQFENDQLNFIFFSEII